MRSYSVQQRRRLLVRRHHLAGDAATPEAVTRALLVLHATDPATVYLSVLARSAGSTLADVSDAMYARRSLVRWMAMRRTLFLVPREDVPLVQAAISTPLAEVLRRRLIAQLHRGCTPPITGDIDRWLHDAEDDVQRALAARGSATGAQLGADVPRLRTALRPRVPSERPQHVTSMLLTLISAQGLIVRSTPTGPWTSRHHRWEPLGHWWPDGLPRLDEADSQRELARRWLTRFGPATVDDLRWWAGWTKATVRRALERLPIEKVDLHGTPGVVLHGDEQGEHGAEHPADDGADDGAGDGDGPVAALLPALDPTPMGWQQREWFLGIDRQHVFDRAGSIGPTLWWDGEIIGSWAIARTGEIRTAIVADRGRAAEVAVHDAAARLHARLGGAVVTPAARTPLERSLAQP